jgi:serine/threonine protein phosphatase PrpC
MSRTPSASVAPPASAAAAGASIAVSYRLQGATALNRGDRAYQQDQVVIVAHPRVQGCALALVADGMGGKSGGRKAADQVMLTGRQIFERFMPEQDDVVETVRQIASEAHMMIKLTAIAAEQEPHSTVAGYVLLPGLRACLFHSGDSRVYHFRGTDLQHRTKDHSYVQRLVDEGKLTEEEAANHPKSNLLTGCLGSVQDPPVATHLVERVAPGDAFIACSDGLWHYFSPLEMAQIIQSMTAREATASLIDRARQRAQGGGDNLSAALVRVQALD